ncbi:hypothetical protein D910_05400 [Dendroctonus ponderosae]|uniref:SH2 domain-containing protein n=1 Tax=Dendroctonus ponderosae TaxID=77166 RepID=U4UBN1_DENPD|nr:hypothetical protein D910_05400 [Dendroctonus ponderosae]
MRFSQYCLNDRQSSQGGVLPPSPPPLRTSGPPPLASSSRSISRESLISSNGGSDASSERSEEEGYGATCDISLMERLVLSHPIWFLPGIQRAGAFHLLQGKEEGCFVVRKSSQSDTMALSVRLPPDKEPTRPRISTTGRNELVYGNGYIKPAEILHILTVDSYRSSN